MYRPGMVQPHTRPEAGNGIASRRSCETGANKKQLVFFRLTRRFHGQKLVHLDSLPFVSSIDMFSQSFMSINTGVAVEAASPLLPSPRRPSWLAHTGPDGGSVVRLANS